MSRDGEDWDTYGCSRLGGDGPRDLGRAMVAETTISRGADAFVDRPVEALKVIVLNYDRLVRAGLVPDGARTISPSLPRYLLAGGAVAGSSPVRRCSGWAAGGPGGWPTRAGPGGTRAPTSGPRSAPPPLSSPSRSSTWTGTPGRSPRRIAAWPPTTSACSTRCPRWTTTPGPCAGSGSGSRS
ncbi:hypothetical protein V2I01_20870 [Micromonospora sp. BRA006-A]|nr:hypothetical protein [Micromonospora sp. BRA006-A]